MLKPIGLFQSLTLLAALLVPALAHAQEQRLRVSFGGATTAGTLDSQPAIAASVGYRFANRLSFDVEVTAADGAADRFSSVPLFGRSAAGRAGIFRGGMMPAGSRQGVEARTPAAGASAGVLPIGAFSPRDLRIDRDGSTALATFGFRYELPSQVMRFMPYLSGGIGIARTEESFSVSLSPGIAARPGMNATARPIVDIDDTSSHTGLATSAGVGASIRIFRQLSADLDVRYFRLDRGRNLGRFGGGLSYRF